MRELTIPAVKSYALPGGAVFPESIGVDPVSGDAYIGSLADGTLYRVPLDGGVEVWSVSAADRRTSVAGVKVDSLGRLWAAGGYDGTLYVYDLAQRVLIARLDVGRRPCCVNDIAFGPDGEAYVTDSFISLLFRVQGDPPVMQPWADLGEQGVPWAQGLNFNGIVLGPDGRHLVACQTNLGRFWRIALDSGRVTEIAIEGGPLPHCDGLWLSGTTLHVAVNARNRSVIGELTTDGSRAKLSATLQSDDFAFPTAVAVRDAQMLVVNAQLDKVGGTPHLPFTVAAFERPILDGRIS